MTVGKSSVAQLKPDAPIDYCTAINSPAICAKAFRWKTATNAKPYVALQICYYDGAACEFSEHRCPNPPAAPPASPPPPAAPPPTALKRGMIMTPDITGACMAHFQGEYSWLYSYDHHIQTADQLATLNDNSIEFVPSVHAFAVDEAETVGGPKTRCFLTAASKAAVDANPNNEYTGAASTQCALHPNGIPIALDRQLARLKAQLTVPPQYLFLANEPSAHSELEPAPPPLAPPDAATVAHAGG